MKQIPAAKPPRGTVKYTANGSVLTLPNGKKFVVKTNAFETSLTFPKKQVFKAETAKGGFEAPYVSEDESVVASVVIPSTQSGDLHLFVQEKNGSYREIPDVNDAITKLLKKAGAPFEAGALRILHLNGRALCLASVDYGAHRGEGDLFHVNVAKNGVLSLGK